MIKVLHIIQGYSGGVSSLVRNLIVASDKNEIKQDVLSFTYKSGEDFLECLKENSSEAFLMPRPRVEGYKKFKSYVLDVMKNGNYDVVHCHSDGWRSTIFKKLSLKAGIKVFCIHAHRTANDPGFIRNSSLFLMLSRYISKKNADIIFTCGEDAAKFVFGKCNHTVIPNGVDLNKCLEASARDRDEIRKQLSVEDDEILIFHAGRFVVQKNHEYMINIAECLRDKGVRFKMCLAGSGVLEPKIKSLINEKALINHVNLLGRRDDIYNLMYASDCVILPSTSEGLPTVVMEAQIMSTPCFASENVTSECDLGLGLVKFIGLDSVDDWAEAIKNHDSIKIPDSSKIIDVFQNNAYTSVGSANRYLATLKAHIGL